MKVRWSAFERGKNLGDFAHPTTILREWRTSNLFPRGFKTAIRTAMPGPPVLMALDDTPTKRFGPEVEGAARHRNPTPHHAES